MIKSATKEAAQKRIRIALAGNPNTGKTTLFNRLTGARAKVGNYPGVTVDRHFGEIQLEQSGRAELQDVPGTYSLSARSAEEQLALYAIAGIPPLERPDLVVVVLDATQLERNLYLALQVIELGLPVLLALNMFDRLEPEQLRIDPKALSKTLGVPAVGLCAQTGLGMGELLSAMDDALARPESARAGAPWLPQGEQIDADLKAIAKCIPAAWLPQEWKAEDQNRKHALALWALLSIDENDELEGIPPDLRQCVLDRRSAATADNREIDKEVIRARYEWIEAAVPSFMVESGDAGQSWTDRVDRILLHPALGFGIFLLLMGVVFQSLFTWADPAIGWIEDIVGSVGGFVESQLPAGLFSELIVSGVIEGVGSVLVFLPQILLLFFFIGLMEDTGYIARVAFIMDRLMKLLGLHGRAFVPMLSGYACAVPAILGTRTMERRRDRMLTMMVVPLMTCSARLPVYGLLIAALVPPGDNRSFTQGLLMVAMYLFSTVIAFIAAAVLGRTLFKGPKVPLLLEMPPYRRPHFASVLRMMLQKSSVFVREAGTVIMACTIIMWALLSFPRQDQAGAASSPAVQSEQVADAESLSGLQLRQSYAGRIGRWMEPTIEPLGFDWKIGIGLIGAFAAREVFVSTLAIVYDLSEDEDENSLALRDKIRNERRSDGSKLYTPLVCLSLMVFFALACQCMSTLAVVKRETNSYRWPAFMFAYMTVLAWVASFIVYQGGKLIGFS